MRRLFTLGGLTAAALGLALSANAAEVSTKDTGHVQNPVWSPDGQWLAFEINNMSNSVELWLAKVNGAVAASPTQLNIPGATSSFGGGGYAAGPIWASNPSLMLIFEGANAGGTMRLYYANPGAGAPNELITASQMTGNLHGPAMSNDGQRFAFVSDVTGNGDIYVWELSDNSMVNTFTTAFSEHAPAWNDDGDKLSFSRKNNGTEDLFTWSGGSTTSPLKGGNGDQTRPIWVGDKVAYFTSERGEGKWDIAVATDGGKRTVIAKDVRLPARSAPAVTPDGQWVAYGSADPEAGNKVFFTSMDGGSTKTIDTDHKACGEPSIIESGGRLMLAYTALPSEGSDWRRLHVVDITGKL
jgi:TolB protein